MLLSRLEPRTVVPFAAKQWIRRHPSAYYAYLRWFTKRRHGLVSAATDVTIEGFPRSGNSFAVRAFTSANPEAEIAHHTHTVAQVLASVKRRVPTLIVVRQPDDAVRSLLVMQKRLAVDDTLAWYVDFHQAVVRHRDELVVALFDEVTSRFDRSIERLNARFGTPFAPFQHDPENVQRVFDEMDRAGRARDGDTLRVTHLARPLPDREGLKHAVTVPDSHPMLGAARDLYSELARMADPTGSAS